MSIEASYGVSVVANLEKFDYQCREELKKLAEFDELKNKLDNWNPVTNFCLFVRVFQKLLYYIFILYYSQ